jgi:outer membrane protein insertion porin family/translocation and assembly module TamA
MPLRRGLRALGFVVGGLCVAASVARAQDIGCDPGDMEVVRVSFNGNHAFTDAQLGNGLVTTPSSWTRRTFRKIGAKRCLDTLAVKVDPLRLLVYYDTHGFTGTRASARVDTVRKNAVAVTFRISEGAPIILEQFTISGLDSVPRSDRITAGLGIVVGGRFDKQLMLASQDTILKRLRDNGYPNADLLRSYETDTAKRVANLKLDVIPGPRAHIGAVKLTVTPREGNDQEVSDRSVRRTLGFAPGDLYRERELESAKRALYLSEAYRHVEVAPDTASLQPAGDSTIDVNVTLAESYMRSVRPSAGWATLDCFRTQIDYTDLGFLGGLRRLDISARASKIGVGYPTEIAGSFKGVCSPDARKDTYSDTLNYYAGVTLRQSSLFGIRAVPTVTLYSELRSEFQVYRRYSPIGAILSLNQSVRRLSTTYAYQLEYGRTSAEPAIFCGVIGVCDANEQDFLRRTQRLATASFTIGRDRRNDPFYPKAGSTMSLELRGASKFIGSDPDLQFSRVVADASWYWALPRSSVLVARLRGGVVFGQRIALGADTSSFIPQQERLYAGGANTVRGFRQNELGPVVYLADQLKVCTQPTGECVWPTQAMDTVYFSSDTLKTPSRVLPVGGNSVAVANVELRMPSPFLPERVQIAFFADAGQVWTRAASRAEQSFGSLKVTPGVGVRVGSPVGPIRLDIGYNPYERRAGAAYFDTPQSQNGGSAPLYCVTPGNGLPVTGWPFSPKDSEITGPQGTQANPSRGCPTTFRPPAGGFFRHLTFNVSIGQAF